MDLRDAATAHVVAIENVGRSAQTQRIYLFYERLFLRYLDEHHIPATLDALNPINARAAAAWYRRQDAGSRRKRNGDVVVRNFLDHLKTWANWLTDEGVFQISPLKRLQRISITKHLPEPYTMAEIKALILCCAHTAMPARDEAILRLLLDTGMRKGELVTIRLSDLNLKDRMLLVGARGKSRRERMIALGVETARNGGRTLQALRRWLVVRPNSPRSGDALFTSREGYALDPSAISYLFRRLGDLAGVANPAPHRTRHTFATFYLTENPSDLTGLQRILGHALSSRVTQDYVHLAQAVLDQRRGRSSLSERV